MEGLRDGWMDGRMGGQIFYDFTERSKKNINFRVENSDMKIMLKLININVKPQPYHPANQEEVLVRQAGGAHPEVCVGPNAPV